MIAEDGGGEPPAGSEPVPDPVPETTPVAIADAGWRAGKSYREIAVDLYGADPVDAEWRRDGWMRARVRRLVHRAHAAAKRGPCGE